MLLLERVEGSGCDGRIFGGVMDLSAGLGFGVLH